MPTLVSTHRAAELLLFGERFGAEAARDLDSVNPVVADADLLATAKAQQLAQKPPRALRTTKMLLKCGQAEVIKQAISREGEQFAALLEREAKPNERRRCPMMKKAVILVLAIMVSVTCSPARTQAQRPARKHTNPPPTPNTVDPQLVDKLAAAKKPAVGQPLVIEGSTVCGPRGNAADTKMQELNNNKNRTDEPADGDLIPISWDDLNNLPADRVNDIQGAPVSVVGYLSIRVKQQTGAPGETTNCNLLNPDEVDWHMYLTKGPRQPINTAIIVETTPRVRPNHKWTTQMVAAYVNRMKQLRISGSLMYDFQHLDVVGRDRGTVWEVHPITKIEVQDQAGNWANLEQ